MDILTKDLVNMRSLCEKNQSLDNWEMAFEDIAWRYGHSSNLMYEVFKLLLEEGKIPTIYQKPLLFQIYINYNVDKSFVTTLKRILKTETKDQKEARILHFTDMFREKIDKNLNLTVFRGIYKNPFRGRDIGQSLDLSKAISFTINKGIAEKFAARFVPEEAKVITAKVPVDKILLYNNDRGEEEVVIIPLSAKERMNLDITEEIISVDEWIKRQNS
ncbi:MAG: hypothetical protein GX288_00275 [Clostridiales bacterium]|nr:hypothetical protein [Clostridiales bacterium]